MSNNIRNDTARKRTQFRGINVDVTYLLVQVSVYGPIFFFSEKEGERIVDFLAWLGVFSSKKRSFFTRVNKNNWETDGF